MRGYREGRWPFPFCCSTPLQKPLPLALLGLAALWAAWLPDGNLPLIDSHPFNGQRVGVVGFVTITTLVTILFSLLPRRKPLFGPWPLTGTATGLVAVVLGLGLVSAITSARPGAALFEWSFFLLAMLALTGLAIWVRGAGPRGAWILIAGILAGVILILGQIYAGYLWATFAREVPLFWSSPFFGFGNIRFFNQYQAWTLPLWPAALAWAIPRSRTLAVLLIITGGGWWALLLASGGRGPLVALTVATLVALLTLRPQARQWLGWQAVLLVLGLGLYTSLFVIPDLGSPGLGRASDALAQTDHARLTLWSQSLDFIRQNPLLGIGPMHFALGGGFNGISHPHNAPLQLAAEWGLPAAFLAASLVVWSLVLLGRHLGGFREGPEATLALALWSSVLSGGAYAFVSGVIVMPVSQGLLLLVAGSAWGLASLQGTREQAPPTATKGPRIASPHLALLGLALVASGYTLTTIERHMSQLADVERAFAQRHTGLNPRIWLQGRLDFRPWSNRLPSPTTER